MNRRMKALGVILALAVPIGACRSTVDTPEPVVADSHNDLMNAVVWIQTAAEADAVRRQAFAVAMEAMDRALDDPTWTAADEQTGEFAGLPPAVIVDVDETVLDNSALEARFIRDNSSFNARIWRQWVEERKAEPLPGALEFARHASERGVTIFYVTNRNADEEAATRDNLVKVGFPVASEPDVVLTRGENGAPSDKAGRRALVADTHRVLLMFGDDLGDFTSREGSVEDRLRRVVENSDRWGKMWFMLPNPMYGSWEGALEVGSSGDSSHARKVDALEDGRD